MWGKQGRWALLLVVTLAAPSTALAWPILLPCRDGADCPRGQYSPLHYWATELYKARAFVHPSSLDQYPPGPCPAPPAEFSVTKYPCRAIPAAPTTPYADPVGYFGRPVSLPFALP